MITGSQGMQVHKIRKDMQPMHHNYLVTEALEHTIKYVPEFLVPYVIYKSKFPMAKTTAKYTENLNPFISHINNRDYSKEQSLITTLIGIQALDLVLFGLSNDKNVILKTGLSLLN